MPSARQAGERLQKILGVLQSLLRSAAPRPCQGHTSLLSNVIMSEQPGHDCGPRGDVNMLLRPATHPVVATVDVLLWVVIPA